MGVFNNFPYANFHELNADWIIEQVRKVMDEWEEYRTDMNLWKLGVDDQLAEFQAWFDNLDVQDEVRTVMNELILSGEFIEITSPQIVSATEAWLAAHITPTTPAVDDTLSISGAAADAKVTGDRISDLKEDLYEPAFKTITPTWSNGYINSNGEIVSSTSYKHTDPIRLFQGDTICLSSAFYGFVAIALTDETASFYKPLVEVSSGSSTYVNYYYTAQAECYVALSAYNTSGTPATASKKLGKFITNEYLYNDFEDFLYNQDRKTLDGVKWLAQYIDFDGELQTATSYVHSEPIQLNRGQKITVNTAQYLFSAVSLTDGNGSYYTPVVKVESGDVTKKDYSYTATADCYVALSAYNSPSNKATVYIQYDAIIFEALLPDIIKNYCGINIFPFRTLTGKVEYIYKESVISGLKTLSNFNVLTNVQDPNLSDYSEKALMFKNHANEGVYPITIKAVDQHLIETSKTVNVTVKTAPAKKLMNKSELNVCFIGDSLLQKNANKIGEEWVRMLNTNDSEQHIIGDVIQLPTLYATDGKIRMCGEIVTDGYNYTAVANSYNIMRAKRNSSSGPVADWGSENPFYNPNSTEPDTVGEDGFNRRVDFGWWFDNNIGAGKNPDIIYLATGPNDFANRYGWKLSAVDTVVSQIIAVCKKIKQVCNMRGGGSSSTVVKILQHQPYAYCAPTTNFPQLMQRVLWFETAQRLYDKINDENMDVYVEIIPFASRFDTEICYTRIDERNNDRYTGYSDVYVGDPIHMNTIGAYNYADVLITDFMADARFD